MSTPGAIAVYLTTSATPPRHVADRAWRGVYHHWDGDPSSLGTWLIEQVKRASGDLAAVVHRLIDEAPWGWSAAWKGEPNDEESAGPPVAPHDTGAVAYVYVFDVEARRLDAFDLSVDETTPPMPPPTGALLGSVSFGPGGEATPRRLDLLPEELVEEPPLPGPLLTPAALERVLETLPELESEHLSIRWAGVSESDERSLLAVFRVVRWEGGEVGDVIERELKVPFEARGEPQRVIHYLTALAAFVRPHLARWDVTSAAFWMSDVASLARSGARQQSSFAAIIEASARREGLLSTESA